MSGQFDRSAQHAPFGSHKVRAFSTLAQNLHSKVSSSLSMTALHKCCACWSVVRTVRCRLAEPLDDQLENTHAQPMHN